MELHTVWKVSKYGVICGPYFPAFGLNTEKYGPDLTPYLLAFHALFTIIIARYYLCHQSVIIYFFYYDLFSKIKTKLGQWVSQQT